MRKKFKILYPMDHEDESKRGKPVKLEGKDMLVMNSKGIFFIYNGETYYPSIRKLSDVVRKYDVVWEG